MTLVSMVEKGYMTVLVNPKRGGRYGDHDVAIHSLPHGRISRLTADFGSTLPKM
ncbi:MAG: hypothetical protein ABJG94_02950 [Nitratireductor sp.]|uniref:hypothetical protein n=1 Tax=Parasphingorhabdus sp. TaxID=2709688 RepID=UPI003267963F